MNGRLLRFKMISGPIRLRALAVSTLWANLVSGWHGTLRLALVKKKLDRISCLVEWAISSIFKLTLTSIIAQTLL